jgi:hypothetical protein
LIDRFCTQNDIFEASEAIDKHEMLMDHADAEFGRVIRILDVDDFLPLTKIWPSIGA